MKLFALLTLLGLFQPRHQLDLGREPWASVMDAMRGPGDAEAQARLERAGREDRALEAWERAHAYRWAGQLALRNGRYDAAVRDFSAARAADPGGFDARMATVHLGEVAIRQKRWYDAERELASVEHDADPIVSSYARDRLRGVRERTRRLTLRYGALGYLALALVAFAVAVARRPRAPGTGAAFSRALLVGEGLAIGGAVVVPRATSLLASSGWMAFAIPGAVVAAATWALLLRRASWRARAVTVVLLAVALAAGLYLALDFTWWSIERPIY